MAKANEVALDTLKEEVKKAGGKLFQLEHIFGAIDRLQEGSTGKGSQPSVKQAPAAKRHCRQLKAIARGGRSTADS